MTQMQSAPVEYTIYTFDMGDPKRKGDHSWRKHATTQDFGQALFDARTLCQSRRFERIEIKKKFFDARNARLVDQTLRVLRPEGARGSSRARIQAWVLASLLAALALIAAI